MRKFEELRTSSELQQMRLLRYGSKGNNKIEQKTTDYIAEGNALAIDSHFKQHGKSINLDNRARNI